MAASIDSPAEVVVAGHVCLDVIPVLPGPARLEPGRLLEIGPAEMSTGGAVPNIGLALHRLGVPVRLMGKVGDDLFGSAVLEALRARDPQLAADMVVGAGEITSYSIVISPPGVDRSFLHCSGANDTFTADDVRYDELASARLFHFGYPPIMRAMYADGGSELRRMLARARDAGPAISLDMCRPDPDGDAGRVDWPQLLKDTLPLVDIFVPSIEELLFMLDRDAYGRLESGADVVDLDLLRRLGDQLLGMGTAVVAIKLGEQGLYVRTSDAGAGALRSPVAGRRGVARSRGRVAVLPGAARRRDDRCGRLHDRGLPRRAAARRRAAAGGDQRDGGRRRERRGARRDQRRPAVARARRPGRRRLGAASPHPHTTRQGTGMKSLDAKLASIHAAPGSAPDFILADAKDADMAAGLAATGADPRHRPAAIAGRLPRPDARDRPPGAGRHHAHVREHAATC